MNKFKRLVVTIFIITGMSFVWYKIAYATASVTPATGGSSISADDTGGSYTTLTGPTITEGANKDVGLGTIVLTAPSGFVFNTGATVTATITRDAGSKTCFTVTSTTATPTLSTITFTVDAQDGAGGNPATTCHVTFSNIQVRPSAGTPLASGDITHQGTATITGITGSTNLGTLTEVVGAATQVGITQQPSSTAVTSTDFATKPIVAIQDQFTNTRTGDNSSTITYTVVQSSQSCGGTAGSGILSSTPSSGATVSSGLVTYSAMQYDTPEAIKICFASTGLTSALSNTVTVSNAVASFTQANYQWYVDDNTLGLTDDPWSSVSGVDLGENVAITITPATYDPPSATQELRLRMNFTIGTTTLGATSTRFKLEYRTGTDSDCSTGSWTDVDTGNAWDFASSGVTDGSTLTTFRLGSSDVEGSYVDSKPSALNPNSATTTQDIEYDFHIVGTLSSSATRYLFRAVETTDGTDETVFADGYTNCAILYTEPGTSNMMRHGNIFAEGVEQGFFWAD